MKRKLLTSIALFGLAANASADINDATSVTMKIINTSDDVGFNIAADQSGSATPNVLSDLQWSDMNIWALAIEGKIGLGKHVRLMADARFGLINDGTVTDRDFLGDNRTLEFSRATATVDGRYDVAAKAAFGWELRTGWSVPMFKVGEGKRMAFASDIRFTPLIGYGYATKEIEFVDGVQLIPPAGPFSGLNSSYSPEWRGPFAGFQTDIKLSRTVALELNGNYWITVNFSSEAVWNLRSDFAQDPSFVQSARGDGYDFEVGLTWDFAKKRSIGLAYIQSDLTTRPGTDETFTPDDESFITRLNEASWQSSGWALTFEWRF